MSDILTELLKAMNGYGPTVSVVAALAVLVGFFIWQQSKREQFLQKQIDELHDSHNEVVLPLLSECKEAIAASKEVINQNSQIIASWLNRRG